MSEPEKFDPAKYDPAKVPSGWMPPAGDLPGEGKALPGGAFQGVKGNRFKGGYWACGIAILVVVAKLLHKFTVH
jgi:hypothetical protein